LASQFTNFEVDKTLRLFDGMGSALGPGTQGIIMKIIGIFPLMADTER
jgi:hypothetical protein